MQHIKPLQEQAYDHIRALVIGNQFQQATIYSETKLAAEIGISRTPVRDALQRLAQEGLIDIIPSKGFMLHTLTPADLVETYHIRCAVEGYCMQMLAAQKDTTPGKKLLTKLSKLLEQQRKVCETSADLSAFCALDQQFHTLIVAFAQSGQFNELFHNHMHRIYKFALQSFDQPGRVDETVEEHSRMLEAAAQGDAHKTYQATLHHMETLRDIILPSLQL